jgi:hypothetical protein
VEGNGGECDERHRVPHLIVDRRLPNGEFAYSKNIAKAVSAKGSEADSCRGEQRARRQCQPPVSIHQTIHQRMK